jgi:hypothetical protein
MSTLLKIRPVLKRGGGTNELTTAELLQGWRASTAVQHAAQKMYVALPLHWRQVLHPHHQPTLLLHQTLCPTLS